MSRGGKAPRLAVDDGYCGPIEADAAWHFIGSPTPPKGLCQTDIFLWQRAVAMEAEKFYSAQGLANILGEDVSEQTWRAADGILKNMIRQLAANNAPRNNSDKNDPRSMGYLKKIMPGELKRAMDIAAKYSEDMRVQFIDDNLPEQGFVQQRLNNAFMELAAASLAVQQFYVGDIEAMHDATCRRRAGRALKLLAIDAEHDAKKFVAAFHVYDASANAVGGFVEWYQSLNKTD